MAAEVECVNRLSNDCNAIAALKEQGINADCIQWLKFGRSRLAYLLTLYLPRSDGQWS
ncbi:MAG: hypothetical protein VKJ46_04085 [Leptolyngbyaceae bacterium]|nr:hypothetical protein [Leptolyngbyaceae bacterium]